MGGRTLASHRCCSHIQLTGMQSNRIVRANDSNLHQERECERRSLANCSSSVTLTRSGNCYLDGLGSVEDEPVHVWLQRDMVFERQNMRR